MSMPPMDFKAIQKRIQENLGYNQSTGTTKYSPGMSANQASAGASGGATGGVIPKIASEANKVLDKPFAGIGATQGMSATAARSGMTQSPPSKGSIPPIYNAATNTTGKAPELGYGSGGTYGTTKGLSDAYKANSALIGTDAGKQSEIARTQSVIAARKAAGLDTSQQEKYLTKNLGYNVTGVEDTAIVDPTPVQPPVDYLALARAELERGLAERRSAADQAKAGLKSEWDRSNEMLGEGRTMDRLWLDRNASPFTGQTLDKKDNLAREWSQADEASLNRYNQNIAGIESGYTDYANTLEDQITARAYELEQQALGNARADASLTGTYNGTRTLAASAQDYSQSADTRDFNYNAGQDALAASQWAQTFEEDKKRYGEETAYKKARDKITDAQDKRNFDEQVRQNGVSAAVSWYNAKTSSANAATSAASLAWSKDPNNPDNILKNKQIVEAGKPDLNKAFDQLSGLYVAKDPYTGAATVSNPTALRSAIIGMGLSDSDTDAMLLQFGLQPN